MKRFSVCAYNILTLFNLSLFSPPFYSAFPLSCSPFALRTVKGIGILETTDSLYFRVSLSNLPSVFCQIRVNYPCTASKLRTKKTADMCIISTVFCLFPVFYIWILRLYRLDKAILNHRNHIGHNLRVKLLARIFCKLIHDFFVAQMIAITAITAHRVKRIRNADNPCAERNIQSL